MWTHGIPYISIGECFSLPDIGLLTDFEGLHRDARGSNVVEDFRIDHAGEWMAGKLESYYQQLDHYIRSCLQ